MPIEFGLWRMDDDDFRRLSSSRLDQESRLEELLIEDPNVLGRDLLVVGQQVRTPSGNWLDILGMDPEGDLHVVELKRDRTPRDVVAQALDYASWVRTLTYDDIVDIFDDFDADDRPFEVAFGEELGGTLPDGESGVPEDVNQNHTITIVASELDGATERIIEYLAEEYSVPLNAVRFNYYEDEGREYIGRSWLIDPADTPEQPGKRESWNGRDYHVSFVQDEHRQWSDAREYGFVSAGQGEWYSRTLDMLDIGDRIFVRIPSEGYVGVGTVTREKTPVTEFMVETSAGDRPISEVETDAQAMEENADDPGQREYLVGVDWLDTRDVNDAFWETGMYSSGNTVTKLRNQYTLDRLYEHFDVEE